MQCRSKFRRTPAPIVLLPTILLFVVSAAQAQLPATRLGSVYPSGGNPGKSVEVTIAGDDLDDVKSLHFSQPGIKAEPKMIEPGPFDQGPQVAENQFVVTIPANTPLGVYEVRAVGKYGISNPHAFTVGDVPETIETETNDTPDQANEVTIPAVINGMSDRAGDVDYFRFTAPAGQRLVLECQARRIDTRTDPVVAVYDAAGRELSSNRGYLGRGALLDFTTPASGEYKIRVHDAVYQGGPDYAYRLSVGNLPHIDFVFPPAAAAGGNRPVTIYGRNLPGGQPAGLTVDGRPLEKLTAAVAIPGGAPPAASDALIAPPSGGLDFAEYRVKGPQGSSNIVLIGVATAPPVNEQEPNNGPQQAQKLAVPCEVMGQFVQQRDRDWFQFDAKQGESFTVEVISQRMGLVTNPALLVQRVKPAEGDQPEQAEQLAYVYESGNLDSGNEFDTRSEDPSYRFTAPADGTYRVMVRDSFNDVRADPRHVYRLAIRKDQPDFRLVAVPEGSYSAVLLRKGGQASIRVVAFRRDGFDGEIRVTATGLPAGVTCNDAVIGPARDTATIVLTAAANAPAAESLLKVTGTAQIGAGNVAREARYGSASYPPQANVPNAMAGDGRLVDNLAISVSAGETAPVSLTAGNGQVLETSRGGIIKVPYARSGPFTGKLTLQLRDLPPNINSPQLTINPNTNSGEHELRLQANTPTGTYTVYFAGTAEQVDYSRNPEAAAAAAARQKEVDQIKAAADAAAKAAADAKTAADKAAAETAAAAQAAETARTAAEQAVTNAGNAAKEAADKAAQAKAAAAANASDANLAAAATAAQKAADDAAAAVQVAMTNRNVATKALEDAQAKAQAASEAKAAADEKAAEAAERARLAAELKAAADKKATDLANAAKPQKRNVPVVSTPATLKITAAPITMAVARPGTPLKQADKLELNVTINRLYAFNGAVNVSTVLPPGVGGLSIANASIAGGQNQTKLTCTASADATPGQHTITVRATLNFNGQNLTVDEPVELTIQAVQQPAG